ncbi:MAG: hypothetical protein WD342_16225 [Verrucomicrobiales bacterium]
MMSREPTDAEYERYFKLHDLANEVSDIGDDLTDAENRELKRLEPLIAPWLYIMDVSALAIEDHGLTGVSVSRYEMGDFTRWISDRFAVIPEHRKRPIDGLTHFAWAILPFDEQPVYACSMFFEDGKFRRDEPELLDWDFDRWVWESIQARRAYKNHFGIEFPDDSHSSCEGEIEKWIEKLNI